MKSVLVWALVSGAALAQNHEAVALAISRDIQSRHVPFGTVLNPMYLSRDSADIQTYTRCGDSAIWTGHWLAAEAFRYAVTRTPEALDAVSRALEGVEQLSEVTGSSNLLARCVVDPRSPWAAGPRSEERHHGEYRGTFRGRELLWFGNTSRDQYMGVFFGLSVAYEQIPDSAFRTRVAAVATRLIDRLLDKEWAVVMPDGNVSTVFWLRPDQLLAILQVGRQVNPARFRQRYEDRRRNLFGFDTVLSLEAREQHDSYFKFNLNAIMLYCLVRLEERESGRRSSYLEAYATFRRGVAQHGNAFFNSIDRALTGAEPRRDAETQRLLAEWLQRPTRDEWVDLRGRYRACGSDRACDPIPVPERVRTDFLWQRSPFLLYGGGEGRIEAPGIEFILPYWMERFYGRTSLAVVSAASGAAALAPDSLATLYGSDLGDRVLVTDTEGATREARVFYAGPGQINFLVPSVPGGMAILTVGSQSVPLQLLPDAPALFSAEASGRGVAAATAIQETSAGVVSVPVFHCEAGTCDPLPLQPQTQRPVHVSLYGTGLRNAAKSLRVTLGGETLPVLFAGPHPEFAGLDQINVRIDATFPQRGELDLVVSSAERSSNSVRLVVR